MTKLNYESLMTDIASFTTTIYKDRIFTYFVTNPFSYTGACILTMDLERKGVPTGEYTRYYKGRVQN